MKNQTPDFMLKVILCHINKDFFFICECFCNLITTCILLNIFKDFLTLNLILEFFFFKHRCEQEFKRQKNLAQAEDGGAYLRGFAMFMAELYSQLDVSYFFFLTRTKFLCSHYFHILLHYNMEQKLKNKRPSFFYVCVCLRAFTFFVNKEIHY